GGGIMVEGGATLGGTGTLGDVAVASGGILAPGTSPGELTMALLELDTGSILDFELGTPDTVGDGVNDLIVVTGDLTLGGTVNVTELPGFGSGLYTLIRYGNLVADTGLTIGDAPEEFDFDIAVGNVGVSGAVTLT